MNIGDVLLNDDIYVLRSIRRARAASLSRFDYLARHGSTSGDIVHALERGGSMETELLFLAIPNRSNELISQTINRMVKRGDLLIERHGEIKLVCLPSVTQ